PETQARADRIGRHMSYQLTVKDKYYKRDKNAMFLAAALHGCDFTKTYFDPIKNRNVVERVPATDLVLPYAPGYTNVEQLERKTHIIYKSVNDTMILAQNNYFLEEAVPVERQESDIPLQQVEDTAQGLTAGIEGLKETACLLEQ